MYGPDVPNMSESFRDEAVNFGESPAFDLEITAQPGEQVSNRSYFEHRSGR
jgi:hypothetical protein